LQQDFGYDKRRLRRLASSVVRQPPRHGATRILPIVVTLQHRTASRRLRSDSARRSDSAVDTGGFPAQGRRSISRRRHLRPSRPTNWHRPEHPTSLDQGTRILTALRPNATPTCRSVTCPFISARMLRILARAVSGMPGCHATLRPTPHRLASPPTKGVPDRRRWPTLRRKPGLGRLRHQRRNAPPRGTSGRL